MNRKIMSAVSAGLVASLPAVAAGSLGADSDFADYRGLWVTRFEFGSEDEIRTIINRAAALGITDVQLQVRGQGDAMYRSDLEPWAREFGQRDPGFDALEVAVDAAQRRGIKLHAYINMMPLWNGTAPPTSPDHKFNSDPETFRLTDRYGNYQPLHNGYVIANPVLPEVHQHLTAVASDITRRYEVAGVHMDYIRFASDYFDEDLGYPADARSHGLFRDATGLEASENPGEYRDWIATRITDLVRSVRDGVKAENPDAVLSAAVWRDYRIGYDNYQQDARRWVDEGLIDAAIPMIYTENQSLFESNVQLYESIDGQAAVIPGIGSYMHDDAETTRRQLEAARRLGTNGFQFFAYNSLFADNAISRARKEIVHQFISEIDPPEPTSVIVIEDFEDAEGYLENSPTYSGSNRNINAASAERVETYAVDGSTSQVIEIDGGQDWLWRHVSGIGGPGNIAVPSGNLALVAEGYIGLWLMTETEGLEISIVLDDPDTGDRGLFQEVIADGQFHLYEWNLEDVEQWEAWADGDGIIDGPFVTLDSIQLRGDGDALFYIDAVSHNPAGSLVPEPGSGLLLLAGGTLLAARRVRGRFGDDRRSGRREAVAAGSMSGDCGTRVNRVRWRPETA